MNRQTLKQFTALIVLGVLNTPITLLAKNTIDTTKALADKHFSSRSTLRELNKPASEWYMKTSLEVVTANGTIITDNASGVLGHLQQSLTGYDKHDIPAFGSTANSQGAIVFVHGEEWGEQAGEYLSDYHGTRKKNDHWVFNVNSTHSDGMVTLHWDGLFILTANKTAAVRRYTEEKSLKNQTLKKLHLIHLDTYTVIDAISNGQLNSYTFNMDGQSTHQFVWVLGPVNASHFEPASGVMQQIKARQMEMNGPASFGRNSPYSEHKFGLPPK